MRATGIKIFSGSATKYLAEKIAYSYGKRLGEATLQNFSDGEVCPVFNESIRGCDVFLVQSTFPPADNLMELLLMVDAAKRASALSVTAVIPYFGFARQDRKDKPRVPIAAKTVATMLEAVGTDRLMTCDLHAGQIQGFFDIPVDHLQGMSVFVHYIKNLNLPNLVFATPDMGGVNRARMYAKHFNAEMVICDKHRTRANEIASMQVIGDVKDANVILIDDMIDTAGTICSAAKLLLEKGALSVRAICTHPVLSGQAYERIQDSELTEVVISDTIPLKAGKPTAKITVMSIADLFAKAIRMAYDNESISSLYI